MSERTPGCGQPQAQHSGVLAGCLAILAFSCAIDLFFYTGYYASDDTRYLRPAWEILSQGSYQHEPGLAQGRLTVVGWNTLVALLFGFNIPLIAGSYVFFHQALNLLTFLLGRRLFDSRVGLLAMYLTATTPLAVTFSTTVLPDLPMTSFLLLSLLTFLWSYDLRAKGRTGVGLLAIFLSGLSVGGAYTAKETALVALPFYFVTWLWFERRLAPRKALLAGSAFAVGILAVFVAEWVVLSHLAGHSYLRLSWAVGAKGWTSGLHTTAYGRDPVERVTWLYDQLGPWFRNTRFDYLLAGAALLYPFVRGRKLSIWWLAIWFFAFLIWGTTRLTEYVPPPLQARYFTPILPLLFIAYSFLALKLWQAVPRLVGQSAWGRRIQALFAAALFLHPVFGLDQGFDEYVDCTSYPSRRERSAAETTADREAPEHDITNPKVLAAVQSWLRENTRRPFFMFIHLWDVHFDFIPPPPHDTKSDPDYTGDVTGERFLRNPKINENMPKRDLEHLLALYDGEIAWTDEHVGEILDELEALELLDSTLTILTADHGTAFFEHNLKGHRNALFEEVIRIPLVVRYPAAVPAGQRHKQQTRTIDLLPTVLDLLGVRWRQQRLMGQSLAPLFAGDKTQRDEPAISELSSWGHELQSFRRPERKTIWNLATDKVGVFDLRVDPGELTALSDREAPAVQAARRDIKWSRDFLDAFRRRYPQSPPNPGLPLELLEKLKSLGYEGHALPAESGSAARP